MVIKREADQHRREAEEGRDDDARHREATLALALLIVRPRSHTDCHTRPSPSGHAVACTQAKVLLFVHSDCEGGVGGSA
jgi:hypothetical protein